MARDQPNRPYAVPLYRRDQSLARDPRSGLTPAEEHALRRSAPLTPTQFEEVRRLTERGGSPLRRM